MYKKSGKEKSQIQHFHDVFALIPNLLTFVNETIVYAHNSAKLFG